VLISNKKELALQPHKNHRGVQKQRKRFAYLPLELALAEHRAGVVRYICMLQGVSHSNVMRIQVKIVLYL